MQSRVISIVVISKDEQGLDQTLSDLTAQLDTFDEAGEIVVVDASDGRLDDIRKRHDGVVRWIAFQQPPGLRISIPHQRNVGVLAALGETIVFTDAGCRPEPRWLDRLVRPLRNGEHVCAGLALSTAGASDIYDRGFRRALATQYLPECPTINLAFSREVYEAVGGFDERFSYGSDVDFSWRLIDAGYRIRSAPEAVIRHDWGTWQRQLRRSYVYGRARLRLYRKHRNRIRTVMQNDPVLVLYPIFLLGLPLTLVFPPYLALLLIPAWRNRDNGPARVVANHLMYGLGALVELFQGSGKAVTGARNIADG